MLSTRFSFKFLMAALIIGGILVSGSALADTLCANRGGNFVFAQDAQVAGLDQHFSSAMSTRNIAMHIYEMLVTRGEDNRPIPELAESYTVSDDGMTYAFKLRRGVKFHNGKEMNSADVLASFERYGRIGLRRKNVEPIKTMSTPGPYEFVITLKKKWPVFIEDISSFAVPLVIIPAEEAVKEPNKINYIGTGPYKFVEWVPDSHVKLERFEDYAVNEAYDGTNGFGGKKIACMDTVTIKIVKEVGARAAGLETGEFHAVETLTPKPAGRLKSNTDITIYPVKNWWLHIAVVNHSKPPTDNLKIRRAMQIALDMEEIMEIASDGNYALQVGYQYPGNPYYVEDGKQWYNVKDTERAKKLLKEAGYNKEPVILITNTDYKNMYDASIVVSEQLKAIGINAVLDVSDWPTAVDKRKKKETWNLFFTGFGTGTAVGARAAVMNYLQPRNMCFSPGDPVLEASYQRMGTEITLEARKKAFAEVQARIYEQVYGLKFGDYYKWTATRSNVKGFVPYRIPRLWNVSFK